MAGPVGVVWDESLLGYDMGDDHPLNPVRLQLTMRLATALGVLDGVTLLRPEPAGRRADRADPRPRLPRGRARRAGRRPRRRPRPRHRGQPDLRRHARGVRADRGRFGAGRRPDRDRAGASGRSTSPAGCTTRCPTTPPVSASTTTVPSRSRGCWTTACERVAYVDTDVHHGDGVQAAFYDDPQGADRLAAPASAHAVAGHRVCRSEIGAGDGRGHRGEPAAAARHHGRPVAARLPRRRAEPAGRVRAAGAGHPVRCGQSPQRPAGRPVAHRGRPPRHLPHPARPGRPAHRAAAGWPWAAGDTTWSGWCRGRGRTCWPPCWTATSTRTGRCRRTGSRP